MLLLTLLKTLIQIPKTNRIGVIICNMESERSSLCCDYGKRSVYLGWCIHEIVDVSQVNRNFL